MLAAVAVAGLVVAAGCGNKGEDASDAGTDGGIGSCDYDDSTGPGEAIDLKLGEVEEGYICPQGDQDWYDLQTSRSRSILGVSLKMKTKLTDVTPTYAVHEPGKSGGEVGDVVASPPGSSSEKELEVQHCLDKGNYKMVVRDAANDDSDFRHAYRLKVTTQENPDDAEPNDSRKEALALKPNQPKKGYIACRGDVDWYRLDVPEDRLVRFKLQAKKPDYQPRAAFFAKGNDAPIAEAVNETSPRDETALDRFVVIPKAGTYFLAVSDDDNADADASVPYTVRYELVEDSDPNEPNDEPEKATKAGSKVDCTGTWTEALDTTGTIGAPGDEDWFRIRLNGCNPGVIEAEMQIQTTGLPASEQWTVNEKVQADLALIRRDTQSACSSDAECKSLKGRNCQENIDCSGYFERCTPQAKCAGAAECLQSNKCGAKQLQRNYECNSQFEPCDPSSGKEPPPNRAAFAAPIFGDDVLYLRAGDFQSDGSAPKRVYSLKVRLRDEPDSNEPNNIFVNSPERGAPAPEHRSKAKKIPIYDCPTPSQATQGTTSDTGTAGADASDAGMSMDTAVDANMDGIADTTMDTSMPTDTGSGGMDTSDGGGGMSDTGGMDPNLPKGCCTNKPWVTGAISYQNDQDWFEYQHPCPGEDCTLRIHYRVDPGPVDTAINVYRQGGVEPWTGAYKVEEKESQPRRSGTFGGTTQQDACFYAYHDHNRQGNQTYYYGINVSDQVESIERGEVTVTNPSSREWKPGQSYSICIEKISDKCLEPPCKVYTKQPDGCGPPKN